MPAQSLREFTHKFLMDRTVTRGALLNRDIKTLADVKKYFFKEYLEHLQATKVSDEAYLAKTKEILKGQQDALYAGHTHGGLRDEIVANRKLFNDLIEDGTEYSQTVAGIVKEIQAVDKVTLDKYSAELLECITDPLQKTLAIRSVAIKQQTSALHNMPTEDIVQDTDAANKILDKKHSAIKADVEILEQEVANIEKGISVISEIISEIENIIKNT